jgi:outer membrane protein assembly factor BamB
MPFGGSDGSADWLRHPAAILRLLVAVIAAATPAFAGNWPQFRGPRVNGNSDEILASTLHLTWKAKLPGPGHSSPIVWGDRIFLTAFEPETSTLRRLAGFRGRLLVLALARADGHLLWRREIPADAIEQTTNINQPASPTPATDGRRVYVYFGSFGVAAFTVDGAPVWERKIGPYPHHMGTGSSPVLSGERLILNVETDGPSFLYSINTRTGQIGWRVPRKTRQAAYSTPVIWDHTIAVAGHESVMAYSLEDGRHLWTAPGLSTYVVPTPVFGAGLLFATSNGPGGNAVLTLRPDGETAWRASRGGAYVASPVLQSSRLFTVNQNCVVSALDTRTGRLESQQRLPTQGECYASPVATAEAIYIATTAGELFTLDRAGISKLELYGRILASPAISNGAMYLRSDSHLYALLP